MFLIGSKYKECVDCPIEPGFVLADIMTSISLSVVLSGGIFLHALFNNYHDTQHVRREIIVMMIIRVKVRVRGQ